MSNLDDRLNAIISQGSDTLQIEDEYTLVPTVTEVPITEYQIVPSKNIQEPMTDYDDDYILTRTTLRGVLGRATGILDVAIINAVNTENPNFPTIKLIFLLLFAGISKIMRSKLSFSTSPQIENRDSKSVFHSVFYVIIV